MLDLRKKHGRPPVDLCKIRALQMIILDELNIAIQHDYVPLNQVLTVLSERPASVHVVITGRGAKQELIQAAGFGVRNKNDQASVSERDQSTKGCGILKNAKCKVENAKRVNCIEIWLSQR